MYSQDYHHFKYTDMQKNSQSIQIKKKTIFK